jgi:hypothetical protein
MEINLDLNARRVPAEAVPPSAPRAHARSETTNTEFRAADALEQALKAQPDVRPDQVAAGRWLVGQPTYPPRETIQKIASLLAMHLNP